METYRQLAQRLDTIPNGFPATESGVELRLLEKLFEPDEAKLATVMRLAPEPAADIAARAGTDPRATQRMLKGMVRKGLIGLQRGDRKLLFHLIPFVFGIYEFQLLRLDTELADLFEQYMQETHGGSITQKVPAINRVIPVNESIPFDLEVFPFEQAAAMLENAKSWGVRDCICRVQRKLIGKGCDHTVENCLSFVDIEGAFASSQDTRAISKEEARRILKEAAQEGLIHTTGNYRDGNFYICNCCTCCCGLLRAVSEFGIPSAVAHSAFRAVVSADDCIGCGACVDRCSFDALSVPADVCQVEIARCVGCGVCVSACPSDALRLERRPEGEILPVPENDADWMRLRAEERDIPLEEIF